MSAPTKDSQGNLVWKPQVGVYARVAADQRESYGGIIGALQDVAVGAGFETKSYPHNFAGIIAAIQDLDAQKSPPPVLPGPNPGGGAINPETGNWEPITQPNEGTLWFDTRQGRLFVSVSGEWIQTNGADGLALITENDQPPVTESNPVLGQFWYNQLENQLYIHDGNYIDGSGALVPSTDPDARPLWRLVNDASSMQMQTTATLPLDGTGPRAAISERTGEIIQAPDLNTFDTQQDYNWWAFGALTDLEEELVNKSNVVIGEAPPTDPDKLKPGLLWYDTESLDLSIYYDDGDTQQWVPVSTPYTYDEDLDVIRGDLSEETRLREIQVQSLYQAIDNLDIASNATVQSIQNTVSTAQQNIATLQSTYITKAEAEADHAVLAQRINDLVIPPAPNLAPYAKKTEVANLLNTVATLPTVTHLNEVRNLIPDVASFVRQVDIDQSIANITTEYLPRNGGTLNGSFIINKTDFNNAALDFSTSAASSNKAFKFRTLGTNGGDYSTYGTTNNLWEQAWQFASDEDFCWIYNDSNKVFSITKEGPACSQLYIGDFGINDTNGRVIHNKIDVRERLNTYQTAFEDVRQAVANSTDYDSLKEGLLTALANV